MMRYAILLFVAATASTENLLLPDLIDKASMVMLKETYLASEDSNVVTAPLGALLLLSLYSSAVNPGTRYEITTLLGSSNYRELTESYTSLGVKLSSMDSSNFTLANKVYVSKKFKPTEEFANTVRSYMGEIDTIDFNDTSSAADTVNQWAAEKSKGHIKNPVSKESIDKNSTAALFNIIFFQGHWHVPFKAEETKEKDFYVNKFITVKKPMMHLLEPLYYYESEQLGARLIELPYKEQGFRMVVVLPDEVDGLASVLDKVTQKGLLKNVLALSPTKTQVNLLMPKFDITSKIDYKPILRNLGVKKVFYEGAPGVVNHSNVTVSKFFQQANIKVDEEGATAGAFTGVVLWPSIRPSLPPQPLDFIVDHPFLFAILHKDVVIFTGTYSQ